jgi:hypothetical protein
MRSPRRPALFALVLLAMLAAVAGAPRATTRAAAADCPAGYERVRSEGTGPDWVARIRKATESVAPAPGCRRVNRPESAQELDRANAEMAARQTAPFTSVRAGAREAALAQRAKLVGAAVPGTNGTWDPIGNTPLIANDPAYGEINGEGLVNLAGRIQDYAYDPRPGKDIVYVATAQGGIWKSADRGDHWTSISDTLPALTTGSVAWAPPPSGNGVGTLVTITGDSNGGGNSYTGSGAFWSTDGGASWHESIGVPSGLLGFRAAADPTNPNVFYAATGGGLFRSADGGKLFLNVDLPTGECAGKPAVHPCFFANQVTDVVVQSPDTFGHAGGKVVAVVGWRAGQHQDIDGHVQAPGNGLYGSPTGLKGSFVRLDQTGDGFAAPAQIGRTELGAATGPTQDHNYLYAVVQDAVKFNSGVPAPGANEEVPVFPYGADNVLNGIYVSDDFGDTWTLMQSGDAIAAGAAAHGSALGGTAQAQLYAPGAQAWYNEWIKPDPSRTDATTHAPTRLLFGLEEIWQNVDTTAPQIKATEFRVIGRYFGGYTCFFLNVPQVPYCPTYLGEPQGGTTTHPDQHGAIFLPGPGEGVTLLVGNDGGAYRQIAASGAEFTNQGWGEGVNDGFHTLMPYGVAVAKDGIVYAGLQDNGHMRIELNGRQLMTFGGDGTWALVDPDDSDVAYEAVPADGMSVTQDGGKTWNSIDPAVTGAQFVAQFAMDPHDSAHIVTGGRDIVETLNAPAASWTTVFDLGTVDHPGEAPAQTDMSAANRMSAIDVNGDAVYLGWCGICDVVTGTGTFKSGIATNVGGDEAPSAGTPSGWHFAAAKGLPQRYITSVQVDPDDTKTVYVTLGGYSRIWVPPGANGDAAAGVGSGHVYKSTDAGATFHDISGDLPDGPASTLVVRGGQLIVGTDFGVYASTSRNGGTWGLLGAANDLPMAPVYDLTMRPGNDNELYASAFGRGIYRYRFNAAAPPPPPVKPPARPPTGPPTHIPTTGLPGAVPAVAAVLTAALAVLLRRRRAAGAGRPARA